MNCASPPPECPGPRDWAPLGLFAGALVLHAVFVPFLGLQYDEAAYSWTAAQVAHGSWLQPYGRSDLFFFPPLFNYLAAPLIALGIDRLYAVRLLTVLLSAGIPALLYLLVLRSGHGRRPALLAAVLWLVPPFSMRFSATGMVETPMLCLVLLAACWLQRALQEERDLLAVGSALALGAAIWIKETPLGLVPVFLLLLLRHRRLLLVWSMALGVAVLPLLVQTFLPHRFDLFFEIWGIPRRFAGPTPDLLLSNLGALFGVPAGGPYGFAETLRFAVVGLFVASLASLRRVELRASFFMRFSLAGVAILVPFFLLFEKKFAYYLLPVQALGVVFLATFLARRRILLAAFLAVSLLLSVGATIGALRDTTEDDWDAALRRALVEKPDARIAVPLPRIAEYVAETRGLRVRFVSTDWQTCLPRPLHCLLAGDFLLLPSLGLRTPDCNGAERGTLRCDPTARAELTSHLEFVHAWPAVTLFRNRLPEVDDARTLSAER